MHAGSSQRSATSRGSVRTCVAATASAVLVRQDLTHQVARHRHLERRVSGDGTAPGWLPPSTHRDRMPIAAEPRLRSTDPIRKKSRAARRCGRPAARLPPDRILFVRRAMPDAPRARALRAVVGGVVGLLVGFAVWLGWTIFPGLIYGQAALTYSDGKPRFWDRNDWWDAVPLVSAALGALLALVMSPRHREGV